jgi:NAD(P)-dependent dehydrogenase (short-subunit alcohol dehydrogenase family)
VIVHTIAPAPLDTPRLHAIARTSAAESGQATAGILSAYRDQTSLGYLPTSDEVAWLIETLLAPEAAILHGSVLSPDAGARHAIF